MNYRRGKLRSDSIDELGLPMNIHNALIVNGISKISQLIEQSKTNELYNKLCDFSEEAFCEIERSLLSPFGLKLYGKYEYLIKYFRVSDITGSHGAWALEHNNIYKIRQLIMLTKKELKEIPKMTDDEYMEIIDDVHAFGLKFADELEKPIEIGLKPLAILHLTLGSLRLLDSRKFEIRNISDLIKHTTEEIMNICKMDEKRYNEIIEKAHSLGLKFADEREYEEESTIENDTVDQVEDTPSNSEQKNQSKLDKIARIQELQKQIAALQQEQSMLLQELNIELSKGDTNARQGRQY